ncbi:four helix bundle protein [Calothrix sp. UHCC 0171]|nr:four helix bundle protein [Calothrix sp. UHCC 0171]MEA5572575.1 four helix bundle protein [Calothrix sp. UHCC 0171]
MVNIRSFKDLRAWQNAMDIAMRIFELTKSFPVEERYSLTDQVRRSSRSVAANISEAWRKRRYPAAFVSKLNDAESEAAETQTWIEVALRSGYLKKEIAFELDSQCEEVLSQLVKMASHPEQWTINSHHSKPPISQTHKTDTETRR